MKLSEKLESLAMWWLQTTDDPPLSKDEKDAFNHMQDYNIKLPNGIYFNEEESTLCLLESELQKDEESTDKINSISIG